MPRGVYDRTHIVRKLSPEHIAAMVAGKRAKMKPLAERFWSKVNKNGPNGCWIFTGHIGGRGYGTIWDGAKVRTAHQISWELTRGERPGGFVLDHICRNRECCNPDHLRLVTPRQNAVENNDSPFALNAQKTHCRKCGTEFHPDNVRWIPSRGPKGTPLAARVCLTCVRRRSPGSRLQPTTREDALAAARAKYGKEPCTSERTP